MDLCDRVSASRDGPRDCLKAIVARLNHRDPHVSIQAITVSLRFKASVRVRNSTISLSQLLDACVNNCGKPFKLEVASRDFEHNLKKLLSSRSHPKVTVNEFDFLLPGH